VVDDDNRLVGVVRARDLAALCMPDFVRLLDHFEFVHDFGAFESIMPTAEQLQHSISEVMNEPVYAEDHASLLHAASILYRREVIDLPIVDSQGKLVGLVSHVDVATALMSKWLKKLSEE
jgi:CBS-domain-containing membrane protein